MTKKGVSKLTATVLLIGLVIAIIAAILLWSRTIVREELEKRVPISEGEIACQTEIEIDIENICIESGKIKTTVQNLKERLIPKIKGRITYTDGSTSIQDWTARTLIAFDKDVIEFGYDPIKTPEFIEIIPVIYQEGEAGVVEVTCDTKKVKSTTLQPC